MNPDAPGELPSSGEPTVVLDESAEDLYEDAPCGYLSTAPDGTILKVNQTFLGLSGYEAAELVGRRRFYDLLPPGAKIYYETHYAPLLSMQGEVKEIALEIIRADGTRLPVLVNGRLKRTADAMPALVRITVFDATDRRRYEQELLHARTDAESRAAAASALQHVSEGVLLVDADGVITILNSAAARIFGVEVADVLGARVDEVVPGWKATRTRIPIGRSGGPSSPAVVPLAVGATTHWLSASGEGAPDGIVYTLRDVTAERRLEDLRDDIIAVVSHELRTPLAGVYGAAQTLSARYGELSDEVRLGLIDMILQQSGRLARILDEILLTQRLDSGDVPVERTSFALADVVERVVAESAGWRNVRPIRMVECDDVRADGDPALFEQVVTNLLDNAMKYSPPDGEVEISILRRPAHARLVIADSGPGVAASDEERVFEKFFRTDSEQITGISGTGLGLYITREIVSRMHGQVGLLPSRGGATFYVDLQLGE